MFKKTRIGAAAALAVNGLALAISPAHAQQQLERVEITGSSIKRVDAETALPVQIITREEIARTGAASTEELLRSLSAVQSEGAISTSTGTGLATYGQASISLRALGEDRTLVLVNGRRLSPFAGGNGGSINVNAIPLAAIERVEVLKDGSSAVYGSDAIAGVVNFILSKDYQGFEAGATLGTPTRSGGGKSQRATLVGGFGSLDRDRFNITASASLEKESQLFGRDRNFAKNGTVLPFFVSGATGQGNIEGAYNPSDGRTPYTADAELTAGNIPGPQPGRFGGAAPSSGYGNPLAAQNNCEAISMFLNPTPSTTGAPFCAFDSAPWVGLVPKRELTTLSLNGSFKVNDAIEAFGDALYSRSVVTQTYQQSPIRRSFLNAGQDELFNTTGVNPVLLVRPTNPSYQIAADYLNAAGFGDLVGQPLAVTARVFDFGPREQRDVATQNRLVAGIRGSVLKQDYEVAAFTNTSKLEGAVTHGYFSQVKFSQVVNDLTDDYNPWSLNQSQSFNDALSASGALYAGPTLTAKLKSDGVDGRISGDVMQLPAGTMQYAAGLQYRKEQLDRMPAPSMLTGDIAGLGGATKEVHEERKITGAFAELNAPIVKGLEGNIAVRNDHYDDVGNTTNFKASLRWQPVKRVLLRASHGSGFRAPTLMDLWDPQVIGTTEQFNDPGTGETDIQVPSLSGGNPNLKPEKSRQSSLGFIFQPIDSLSIGIDYFYFHLKDMIALPTAQEVVSRFRAGDPAFAGLVTLDGNGNVATMVQTLQNVGVARVKGWDLDVNYRESFGPGKLNVNLSGTYMQQFDQTSPGGAVSHKVGTTVEGPDGIPVLSTNASSGTGGVVLRWKHVLSGNWTQGSWDFTLAQNFYKGYRDGNDLDNNPHFVPSQSIYDAQVAYNGIKNLKLALGVKNLFDKDPPLFIPVSNQFQSGYDVTQYDPRARFVYFTANYKFF